MVYLSCSSTRFLGVGGALEVLALVLPRWLVGDLFILLLGEGCCLLGLVGCFLLWLVFSVRDFVGGVVILSVETSSSERSGK